MKQFEYLEMDFLKEFSITVYKCPASTSMLPSLTKINLLPLVLVKISFLCETFEGALHARKLDWSSKCAVLINDILHGLPKYCQGRFWYSNLLFWDIGGFYFDIPTLWYIDAHMLRIHAEEIIVQSGHFHGNRCYKHSTDLCSD